MITAFIIVKGVSKKIRMRRGLLLSSSIFHENLNLPSSSLRDRAHDPTRSVVYAPVRGRVRPRAQGGFELARQQCGNGGYAKGTLAQEKAQRRTPLPLESSHPVCQLVLVREMRSPFVGLKG